jgi:hypothetical protein
MAKVLVLNNYPLDQVWAEVKAGQKPDHHLYGLNYFKQMGYEIELAPFDASIKGEQFRGFMAKAPLVIPLGDMEQQRYCLTNFNKYDLVWAPCQTQTAFLSYLRACGLFKTPIVSLAHHPILSGRLANVRRPFVKLMLQGTDSFPSLSSRISRNINDLAGQVRSKTLSWGPDAQYYISRADVCKLGEGIICAGRTNRDFTTFGWAASKTKIPSQIICLDYYVEPSFASFAQNVSVVVRPYRDHMKYPELLNLYAQSRAIAIPLFAADILGGLTSLMDALAMGKPILMTRNPYIDIDIEKEGIGIWIEPGDINAWSQAIEYISQNDLIAKQMGERAKALVDNGLNSENFAKAVGEIFEECLS